MALHIPVRFQCFVLLLWLKVASVEVVLIAAFGAIAKPSCLDNCGNISIPYPFGIGEGCFRDKHFEVECKHNSWPMLNGVLNVSNISLIDGEMTISVHITTQCADKKIQGSDLYLAGLGRFAFSNTKNKFTVIGCNTQAILGLNGNLSIGAECSSICSTAEDTSEGSCDGIGCCQSSIPARLVSYSVTIKIIDESRKSLSFNPCSYAFIAEETSFKFFPYYLNHFKNKSVPVVVDWIIGNQTCKEAKRNWTSYACGPNSVCMPGNHVKGYGCTCIKGYEGNPYLPSNTYTDGGCQDIDECIKETRCGIGGAKCVQVNGCGIDDGTICINTPGSYRCDCLPGWSRISYQGNFLFCASADPSDKFRRVILISAVGASTCILILLWMGYWLYIRFDKRKRRKIKQKHFTRNGGLLLNQKITSNQGRVERAAKIFVSEELEKTTDNFNPSRIIGKGGFGTVFKGMLSNGEIVAIKKSTLVDETQVDQFINEVVILSQINHRHIVKLLGCCLETEVPLLVYEFVSNGTLSYHLHVGEGDNESLISWKDRVRIASEIAGALAYLHSDSSMPIFHRDIKSTNILLDEKFKVKVSDFGLSRLVPIDGTHLTTIVQGTFGYLDPEYFRSSQFTDKSDVYSFGIVLVELLTGEKAISKIREEEEKGLALYFIKSLKENRLSEILDARVLHEGDTEDVLVVAQLAKRCLKYVAKKRPTMKEVSLSLGGLHEKLSYKDNQ